MNKSTAVLLILWVFILWFSLYTLRNDHGQTLDLLEQVTQRYERTVRINSQLKRDITDLNKCLTEKTVKIKVLEEQLKTLKLENEKLLEKVEELEKANKAQKQKSKTVSRGNSRARTFKATAYDLSVNSCGKPVGSKGYGVTANGTSLKGKSREQAMTVAVDPKVIKLGTKLKITFPKPYEHFNGVYTANDTGGAIKGNKIDIFMGDFQNNETHQSVWDFGVRDVKVEVIK